MNKAAENIIIGASAVAGVIVINQIWKRLNSGVGFFTTERKMAKTVLTSKIARYTPQESITKEDVEWWKSLGKTYRRNWYKAVWKTKNGDKTDKFMNSEGEQFYTKGGKKV